jgi:16S rRNA (uracil1498-N3)-methyltransferase
MDNPRIMPLRVFTAAAPGPDGLLALDDEAAAHVLRVLRLGPGAELVVFDGSGSEYPATIEQANRRGVLVRCGAGRSGGRESPLDVTLLQGLARGARMDLVIQKATELGVTRIGVLALERSVVRLEQEERMDRRLRHWQRVAISACEQCGRSVPPGILPPTPLRPALEALAPGTTRLLLDPDGDANLPALLAGHKPVVLLIGPEGGLGPDERALAVAHGFARLRLGPRILRTETAPLAALSLIQYLAGDLGFQPPSGRGSNS